MNTSTLSYHISNTSQLSIGLSPVIAIDNDNDKRVFSHQATKSIPIGGPSETYGITNTNNDKHVAPRQSTKYISIGGPLETDSIIDPNNDECVVPR